MNSPVVHAETLRFKEEGVFGVIKNVFMPWYNAYRFLVQNVLRLEADCGERFYPLEVAYSPTPCAMASASMGLGGAQHMQAWDLPASIFDISL